MMTALLIFPVGITFHCLSLKLNSPCMRPWLSFFSPYIKENITNLGSSDFVVISNLHFLIYFQKSKDISKLFSLLNVKNGHASLHLSLPLPPSFFGIPYLFLLHLAVLASYLQFFLSHSSSLCRIFQNGLMNMKL